MEHTLNRLVGNIAGPKTGEMKRGWASPYGRASEFALCYQSNQI